MSQDSENFEEVGEPSPTSQSIGHRGSPTFETNPSAGPPSPLVIVNPTTMTGSGNTSATPTPKHGGKYDPHDAKSRVVWVGGIPSADFTTTVSAAPASPMCIRGIDPSSDIKGYSKRVLDGLDTKFKRDDKSFNLMSFASAAKEHMTDYGMVSVFYMKGSDNLATDEGEELFTYHSKYTRAQVKKHIADQVSLGHFDSYAKDALDESAKWLKNSLDESLKSSMRYSLSTKMSGPELWMVIVSEVMADSLRRTDNLKKQFEALSLAQFKGENVIEYAEAASTVLLQLEKDDRLPDLHLLKIIEVFSDCSVMEFKIQFMGRRATVESFLRESNGKTKAAVAAMPNQITYDMLLDEGKAAFNNLANRWGPAEAVKEDPTKALMARFEALEAKLDQRIEPKDGGGKPKNVNGRTCFDCGADDHLRGDPACPKAKNKSDWQSWEPPKDGEPTKRTAKGGTTIHWCAKCNRGKGRWNTSHQTDDHITGWLKSKQEDNHQGKLAVAQDLVPSFSSWMT